MVRGLVSNGILLRTGETLQQVQDRVLGVGIRSKALQTRLAGYVLINVRGAYYFSDNQEVAVGIENLMDRNYRGVNWGVPGPGFDLSVRYSIRF